MSEKPRVQISKESKKPDVFCDVSPPVRQKNIKNTTTSGVMKNYRAQSDI